MNFIQTIKILQIIVAIILMIVILLQNKGAGLGGVFGGGNGNVFATKRGLEKKLFYTTIILSITFFTISLLIIIL